MNKKILEAYIEKIEAERFRDPKKMLKYSRQLLEEAKKAHDDKATAYGEYFYVEGRYRIGTLNEKMLDRAVHALQLCRKCNLYELEAKCNNMLGIFFLNHGDNITALEYYQTAMDIAIKHRIKTYIRVMTNNMGDLYLQMKQYDLARSYFEKCLKQCEEQYEKERKMGIKGTTVLNRNICLLNLAECSYFLGNMEEALRHIGAMQPVADGEEYYGSARDAMIVLCYIRMEQLDKVEGLIESVIRDAELGKDRIEAIWEYTGVTRALIAHDRMEQAERLYVAVEKLIRRLNFAHLWCDYYEIAIMIAKKRQDTASLLVAYESYIEAKKRVDEAKNMQQVKALKNRQTLNLALKRQKKTENKMERFQHLSEHDALTGLYNRYVLKRTCEKWCMEATANKTNIGVIVLDIDYFKQFNDQYGHLMGDHALKKVSEALLEAVGDKGIVVRYGGDEFFVLTRQLETADMIAMAKEINCCIRKKELLHEMSKVSKYVTLSQGVVNGVPEEGQSVLEVIHLADNALYKAKEVKRSSIGVYEEQEYQVILNETLVKER